MAAPTARIAEATRVYQVAVEHVRTQRETSTIEPEDEALADAIRELETAWLHTPVRESD